MLEEIVDWADRFKRVGIKGDGARRCVPSQQVRIGRGSVAAGGVPAVVIVEVDGREGAVFDLAVVGPVVGK